MDLALYLTCTVHFFFLSLVLLLCRLWAVVVVVCGMHCQAPKALTTRVKLATATTTACCLVALAVVIILYKQLNACGAVAISSALTLFHSIQLPRSLSLSVSLCVC